jgi:hypothetical protein
MQTKIYLFIYLGTINHHDDFSNAELLVLS